MKLTVGILVALTLACVAATVSGPGRVRRMAAATAVPEITPGYANLLVWWKITTNDANGGYVQDWSPSGVNYGTQDTAAAQFTVTNLAGVVCAYMDGGDYSSTTGTLSLFSSTNVTLACWVNRSVEIGNVGILVSRGGEYTALHDWGNPAIGIVGYVRSAITAWPIITNGFHGTWMHLSLTYDGANMRLYSNGVLAVTTARTGALEADDVWRLGFDDAEASRKFNGYLDDARIYNRALTSNEIWTVSQEAR